MNSLIYSEKVSQISGQELNDKLTFWPAMMEKIASRRQSTENYAGQHRILWVAVHSWKDSIQETGAILDVGKSHFPFDQKAFLSMPALEFAVAAGLITSHDYRVQLVK